MYTDEVRIKAKQDTQKNYILFHCFVVIGYALLTTDQKNDIIRARTILFGYKSDLRRKQMKKLILLCVAIILSLGLIVSCGSGDSDTTPGDTSFSTDPADTDPADTDPEDTDPADTDPEDTDPEDTDPADTDPEDTDPEDTDPEDTDPEDTDPEDTDPEDTDPEDTDPEDTDPADTDPEDTEPEDPVAEPEDLLSKMQKMDGVNYFAFEDHVVPGAGSNKSTTITVCILDGTVNVKLFDVVNQAGGNDAATAKSDYTWKLKINDDLYTIKYIGTYYFVDSNMSFIRLEVGTLGFKVVPGTTYTIRLSIENNGSEVYYAELGTVSVGGLNPDEDVGESQTLTGISGPAGNPSPSEGYENLFDNSTDTKLCTVNDAPIIFKTDSAVTITSYSLVAGNDHGSGGRRIIEWTLYGSNSADGGWVELDKQTGDPLVGIINKVEYNFKVSSDKQGSYQYYKLEYTRQSSSDLMELSEIKVYVAD